MSSEETIYVKHVQSAIQFILFVVISKLIQSHFSITLEVGTMKLTARNFRQKKLKLTYHGY